MQVRLFIEAAKGGLKATIRELDGAGASNSKTFLVENVAQAKRRAATVARGHGLSTYNIVDRTKPTA
jgi:hypothetical protein